MSDIKPVGVKSPLHLLPFKPLCAIAAAMQHGAVKYSPWNWQDTSHMAERTEELYGALLRHTLAASDPSQDSYDDESGLHHLCHAGACVLILLFKLGIGYKASKFVYEPKITINRHETEPYELEHEEWAPANDPYWNWCIAHDRPIGKESLEEYFAVLKAEDGCK